MRNYINYSPSGEFIPVPVSRAPYGDHDPNTAKITYRSPPISSRISLMVFRLLLHRVDMPGMKVLCCNNQAAKGRALVKLEQAQSSVVLPLLSALEMRVLHSNQGLHRAYDVIQLPVTCLSMHAHHLVTISRNTGYKRVCHHGGHQLSTNYRQSKYDFSPSLWYLPSGTVFPPESDQSRSLLAKILEFRFI